MPPDDARHALIAAARRLDPAAIEGLIRALPSRPSATALVVARNARLRTHHAWLRDHLPAEMHKFAIGIIAEIGAALVERREPGGAAIGLLSAAELRTLTAEVEATLALMPPRARGRRWLTQRMLQHLL